MRLPRRRFLATALAGIASTRLSPAQDTESSGDEHAEWQAELSRHRIDSVELKSVQMKWPRQVGKNARLGIHGLGPRVLACRLRTDRGATGWGAVRGSRRDIEQLEKRIEGRPVTDLFDPARGVTDSVWTPLDFALHDLAGMILGLPVYKMLGAAGSRTNPCYSGMIYFDDLEPAEKPAGPAQVIENCRQDYEFGYRQLKVKIGRGNKWMPKPEGIERDIEVTRAIAEKFPGVEILVDANDGYTADELLTYLEGIGDIKLFWIEEPFRENVADYAKLRKWLEQHGRQTLLADGEASPDWKILARLSERHLLDVQLVDIVGYGFTAWRNLMPQLKQQGVQASPHAWGHALKTNYVAHLAAGMGNVVTIEGVTCTSEEVHFEGYELRNGRLTVPEAAGFGMKLVG